MDIMIMAENGPPKNHALQPGASQAAGRKVPSAMQTRQTAGNGGTQSHRD